MSTSIRNRFLRGSLANLIAVAANQGSTLVANVLVARILNKTAFGEYAIIVNTLLTVATLAQVSTGYTISKYLAEFRTSDKARAGRILGACAIFSYICAAIGTVLVVVASPWIARDILLAPHLTMPLIIGAAYLAASAVNGYQMGVLGGLEAFQPLAAAGVVSGTIVVTGVGIGASLGGLDGAIAGLSLASIARCLIHRALMRPALTHHRIVPVHIGSLTREKEVFLRFALPAAIAGYLTIPSIWIASTLLVRQPDGFSQMAQFAASNAIRTMVLFAPLTANVVMSSILNSLLGEAGKAQYRSVYGKNLLLTTAMTTLIAAVFALSAPYILALFGASFVTAVPTVYVLIGAAIGESLSAAFCQDLQSRRLIWRILLCVAIPREAVLLGSAFLLVPVYHGLGLGMAYLAAWTVSALLSFVASRK